MLEQQDTTTAENTRYPALPADLIEAFKRRRLTAQEITQWLAGCIRQAESPDKLQAMGEHATGILRALLFCWLIRVAENEVTSADLNIIYGDRYRALVGVALH